MGMGMGEEIHELGDDAVLAVPREVWSLLPERLIRARGVFALAREGRPPNGALLVAMADPSDLELLDEVRFATGYRIRPVPASPAALRRLVALHLGGAPLAPPARPGAPERPPDPITVDLTEQGRALKAEDWIVPLAPGDTKWR